MAFNVLPSIKLKGVWTIRHRPISWQKIGWRHPHNVAVSLLTRIWYWTFICL